MQEGMISLTDRILSCELEDFSLDKTSDFTTVC